MFPNATQLKTVVNCSLLIKVRLYTAINRADFVSWCMLYRYEGNKMHL